MPYYWCCLFERDYNDEIKAFQANEGFFQVVPRSERYPDFHVFLMKATMVSTGQRKDCKLYFPRVLTVETFLQSLILSFNKTFLRMGTHDLYCARDALRDWIHVMWGNYLKSFLKKTMGKKDLKMIWGLLPEDELSDV